MDLAVIIGVVAALGAILGSMIMEGGSPASMFLLPPMVLVLVGTFGAAMASGMLKDTLAIGGLLKRGFLAKAPMPGASIEVLVKLAERARREGLLALEDAVKDVEDPFLKNGLGYAIDGTDPEEVRAILEAKIDAKRATDRLGSKFFADMGGYAPTIGIIGTVLGLVHVLENLSKPAELGHLIAGAFVATLWGVMTANVIWLPLSNKLKRLSELECAQMELVVEGIAAIQAGANPRVVAQRLTSLLPPGAAGKEDKKAA
jgi:chemotaxis protein MotA